jgi:hypothetical protein
MRNTFNYTPIHVNKVVLRYVCDLVSHATGPLQLPHLIFLIQKCCNSNTKIRKSSIMHELFTKPLPIMNYTLQRNTVKKVMINGLCQPILDNTMAHQYFLLWCPSKHWMKITGITMIPCGLTYSFKCWLWSAWCHMSKSYIYEYHHHHHVQKGVRRFACSLILKVNLVSPSLPRSY